MLRHYITKYIEDGQEYAEAWLQFNAFRVSEGLKSDRLKTVTVCK